MGIRRSHPAQRAESGRTIGPALRLALLLGLGASGLSCGAGSVAGISATISDPENLPAEVVAASVASSKSAPLIVRFTLSDPNGDDGRALLEFAVDDGSGPGAFQPMTLTSGRVGQKVDQGPFVEQDVPTNLNALATSDQGVEHLRLWDWPADLFPGQDPGEFQLFPTQSGIVVRVSSVQGDPGNFEVLSERSVSGVTVGNHAPTIVVGADTPSLPELYDEITGIVGGALEIADASVDGDPSISLEQVDVNIQYAVVPTQEELVAKFDIEDPEDEAAVQAAVAAELALLGEGDWNNIIPVGDDAPPSGFTFEGVPVSGGPSGAKVSFAWDVDAHEFAQDPGSPLNLKDQRRGVVLRFQVRERKDLEVGDLVVLESPSNPETDPVVFSESFFSQAFTVDNNDVPIATIGAGAFSLDPDQRRGIPVPFRVSDGESQDTVAVLQWKLASQTAYPEAPATRAALEAALADPDQRRSAQLCTEVPRSFRSTLWPVADSGDEAFLPSLVAEDFGAHYPPGPGGQSGIIGEELQILRTHTRLEPHGAEFTSSNPVDLSNLIDVVALGDGLEAIALRNNGFGSWGLVRFVIATGENVQSMGPFLSGTPGALALTPDGDSVLVGTHVGESLQVERVDLVAGSAGVPVPIGGTSLGPGIDASVRDLIALADGEALVTAGDALVSVCPAGTASLLRGLQTPAGLALDPTVPRQVYLAERSWAPPGGGPSDGRVTRVDLDELSHKPVPLFGLVGPSGLALEAGRSVLLVVAEDGFEQKVYAVPLGAGDEALPARISGGFQGGVGGLSVGANGLRLLALPSAGDLAVGGGVDQRRTIVAWDAAQARASVAPAFDPPLSDLQPPTFVLERRVQGRFLPSAPPGEEAVEYPFVWDSRDVAAGGDVQLRLVPYDSVDGQMGVTSDSGAARPISAELDSGLAVLPASDLANPGGAVNTPLTRLRSGDVDGDGAVDLLVGFRRSNDGTALKGGIAILPRNTEGEMPAYEFSPESLDVLLGSPVAGLPSGSESIDDCIDFDLADLDGDGDVDVLGAFEGTLFNPGGVVEPIFVDQGLAVWSGSETGLAPTPSAVEIDTPGERPSGLRLADMDGDGLPEALSSDSDGNALHVHAVDLESAEFTLLSSVTHPLLVQPEDVTAADVDCDGFLDLVAPSRDGLGKLLIFERNPAFLGSVEFDTPTAVDSLSELGEDDRPESVDVGDINSDGRPDVVVANFGTRTLSVHVQAAASPLVFQAPLLAGGAEGFALSPPRDVRIVDVDGDDRLDLATANGVRLSVFTQRRGGSFEPELAFADPALHLSVIVPCTSVEVADLDGDGDVDLAAAVNLIFDELTQVSGLAIFEQSNAGDFPSISSDFIQSAQLEAPAAAGGGDFDGDGDLDLVAAFSEFGALLPQTSPTVFVSAPESIVVLETPPEYPGTLIEGKQRDVRAALLADINSDGLPDAVTANRVGNNLGLFFQNADGSYGQPGNIGQRLADVVLGDNDSFEASDGLGPIGVQVADLDGDSRLDLISAMGGLDLGGGLTASRLYAFLQSGPMGGSEPFVYAERKLFPPTKGSLDFDAPQDFAVADVIKGDGQLEIISVNQGTANNITAVGLQGGQLGLRGLAAGVVAESVAAADLNGDGTADVLAAATGRLELFTDFPAPAVTSGFSLLAPELEDPTDLALGDVDQDGDLDVVVADEDANRILVFVQMADGTLRLDDAEPITDVSGPRSLSVIDIDGDGDLDILVANEGEVTGEGLGLFYGGH